MSWQKVKEKEQHFSRRATHSASALATDLCGLYPIQYLLFSNELFFPCSCLGVPPACSAGLGRGRQPPLWSWDLCNREGRREAAFSDSQQTKILMILGKFYLLTVATTCFWKNNVEWSKSSKSFVCFGPEWGAFHMKIRLDIYTSRKWFQFDCFSHACF